MKNYLKESPFITKTNYSRKVQSLDPEIRLQMGIWELQNTVFLRPVDPPNPPQKWIFGPKTAQFGPFDLLPDQKTMWTSCLGGFLLYWYQNLYLFPKN